MSRGMTGYVISITRLFLPGTVSANVFLLHFMQSSGLAGSLVDAHPDASYLNLRLPGSSPIYFE